MAEALSPLPGVWRRASLDDLPTIMAIADLVHPTLPERSEVFAERIALFGEGVRVLEQTGAVVGYGVCYPWALDHAPPLDTLFHALPHGANCLFIHDVALLPEARGQKAGQRFTALARELAAAHGLQSLALISVYQSAPFWVSQGFQARPLEGGAAKLAAYGETAGYMVADLETSQKHS